MAEPESEQDRSGWYVEFRELSSSDLRQLRMVGYRWIIVGTLLILGSALLWGEGYGLMRTTFLLAGFVLALPWVWINNGVTQELDCRSETPDDESV